MSTKTSLSYLTTHPLATLRLTTQAPLTLEVAEKVRITISNTDTVARNLVFGSDYVDTANIPIGTLELPVGTLFRVLEFVRFGAFSLVLQSDTLQSAASLEATKIDASAGVVTETLAASTTWRRASIHKH